MHSWMIVFLAAFMLTTLSASAGRAAGKPESTMYVFAHQDDDVDVVGRIVSDLRSGRQVYAVWVTNGGRGGDPVVREKESRAVMELLKVPGRNLFFLGYPDQEACRSLEAIYKDLLKIAENISPVEIVSHAYEGGNIDHDTVALTSHLTAKRVKAVHLEFPDSNIYEGKTQIWKFIPRDDARTFYTPLDKETYALKMQAIRMYESQKFSLIGYETLADKRSLKKNGEPYRVSPDYDYSAPPAKELRYSVTSKGTATFETWRKAVEEFLPRVER